MLDRRDVVLQFQIELLDQLVGDLPSQVAADLFDHQVDGHAGVRAKLGDRRLDALARFFLSHAESPFATSSVPLPTPAFRVAVEALGSRGIISLPRRREKLTSAQPVMAPRPSVLNRASSPANRSESAFNCGRAKRVSTRMTRSRHRTAETPSPMAS